MCMHRIWGWLYFGVSGISASQTFHQILLLHDEVRDKKSEKEAEKRERERKGKTRYTASYSVTKRKTTE